MCGLHRLGQWRPDPALARALHPVERGVEHLAAGRIDEAVDELGTDYLDIFLMHGIRDEDMLEPDPARRAQVLIDMGDVIIHVFYDSVRAFYDLEGLWHDAPRVDLDY